LKDRARSIFLTACAYSKVAYLINSVSQNNPSLFLPSQVNAALALELYFKSLYVIDQNCDFKVNKKHSHDFYALFNRLSDQINVQLTHQFEGIIQTRDMKDITVLESASKVSVPRDLASNLQSWCKVFTKVRYVYDKPSHTMPMVFFPEIEQVVKNTIISLKPEFQSDSI
jgi:hypothetical protein